jgi:hypothetical protein
VEGLKTPGLEDYRVLIEGLLSPGSLIHHADPLQRL